MRQRVLVLDGVLDDDNGTLLMSQLMSLAADDPTRDIALWIHSPVAPSPPCSPSATSCGSCPMT